MRNRFESSIGMSWGALLKVFQARLHKLCEFWRCGAGTVDREGEN
jgi:hypothetical protein